jgi:hypothetical protein
VRDSILLPGQAFEIRGGDRSLFAASKEGNAMTIAGSIVLIMLGAILTWAVEFSLAGLDINVVGVILMIGGLAGLLFGLYRISVARRTVVVEEDPRRADPYGTAPRTTRRVYEDRNPYDA